MPDFRQPPPPRTPSLAQQLEAAFADLRAGQLERADSAARRIIDADPRQHGALNLLAIIALQQGQAAKAIEHLQRATGLKPSQPVYQCNLAEAYRQNHQLQQSIAAARKALALRPDYPAALINLGSACFAHEAYGDALDAYTQALSLAPDNALWHSYRGDTLRALGQHQQAIQAYQRALELSPDLPHALANLGLTLFSVGQATEALAHCQRALALTPQSALLWMTLGLAHFVREDIEAAMEAYAKSYDLDPESAFLRTRIGRVWQEVGDLEQAAIWFQQALGIEPGRVETLAAQAGLVLDAGDAERAVALYQAILAEHPEHYTARTGLARAHWENGDAEEAVAAYRAALELRPGDASAYAQLAGIEASAGAVETANDHNLQALTINPNCIPALNNLAQSLRGKLSRQHATHMLQLLDEDWVLDGARASLHFGLGYYFDGKKDYGEAARHIAKANTLQLTYKKARGWNYDPAQYQAYIDRLIEDYSPAFFQRHHGMGSDSTVPIFIVGLPRSGTTLTEQILASHPQIHGVGERQFTGQAFARLPGAPGQPPGGAAQDRLATLEPAAIQECADWHLQQLHAQAGKAGLAPGDYRYVVDKLPDNYNLLGWIAVAFPNARIIHCRRDVRDIAASCWVTQFGQIRWAFDLNHIAERILQYQRIMDHWRQVLPLPMLEIDYEHTVAAQEQQTRRLLEFLDLPWDDACLQFHKSERLVRTASITQVRQPIYQSSVQRWRRYEDALRPLLERLGLAP